MVRFSIFAWLKSLPRLARVSQRHHRRSQGAALPRGRTVLRVEALEDRALPSTFTVLNLADSDPGSLRAAIMAANAAPGADTINFAPGLHGTIKLASEVAITSDLTLDGPGADRVTVSGNSATRVFNISNTGPDVSDVTIEGLTIANGRATGDTLPSPLGFPLTLGGGILNNGGNLTLDRVTMTNNQAVGAGTEAAEGGAVASVLGAHLSVTQSTFIGNVATAPVSGNGGAIDNDGGSSAVIDHSAFTGNRAIGGVATTPLGTPLGTGGGALTAYGGSTLIVTASTFDNNVTQDQAADGGGVSGGAIDVEFFGYLANGSSALTVAQSGFTGNQALGGDGGPGGDGGQGSGGAIAVEGPGSTSATVTDSSFVGNEARGGNGGFGGGSGAGGVGGALNNYSATLVVNGGFFKDNESRGGSGGFGGGSANDSVGGAIGATVLNLGPTGPFVLPTTTVTGSQFVKNQAVGGTGGASGLGNPGGDGGGARGGAVANLFGTLDLSDSSVVQNAATGGAGGAGGGNGGTARGGGVANDRGGIATISGTAVVNNQATGGAGADGGSGGDALGGGIFNGRVNRFTSNSQAALTLTDSSVSANGATGGTGGAGGNGFGGGLFNAAGTPTATLRDVVLTGNAATGGGATGQGIGGGIYSTGTVYVHHAVVEGNNASIDDDVFGVLTPF
jgi:hypothetical protein